MQIERQSFSLGGIQTKESFPCLLALRVGCALSYRIVLLFSLLASSVGFHMYLWFFPVVYGLSIAATGTASAIGFRDSMAPPEWLACILLIVYDLRLGGQLLIREMKRQACRKALSPELARRRKMPVVAKLALWVTCGLPDALMTLPLFFRLTNGNKPDSCAHVYASERSSACLHSQGKQNEM